MDTPLVASLMTGQFPARHGITQYEGGKTGQEWKKLNRHTKLLPPKYKLHLDTTTTTLPEAFKEHGYATFFAGKWHLGSKKQKSLPTNHGFDINVGGNEAGGPKGGYFSPFSNPNITNLAKEKGIFY